MLKSQKIKFNIEQGVSYLNAAYMSPLLKMAYDKGVQSLASKLSPNQVKGSDFFEPTTKLKMSFSELIGTEDYERIAVIPSVSYGIATVVNNINLKKKDEVLILEEQFPSNVFSWINLCEESKAELRIVSPPKKWKKRGKKWNERILDAINKKTRVVAIPQVHWSEGIIFDLKKISNKAKKYGALLIIDGTQSIGAYPFSLEEVDVDAIICGGYKWLLGTYSFGLAYYGSYFDKGCPIEENWINRENSDDFSNLISYEGQYLPKAGRYSVGESSNFIATSVLNYSIPQINRWTPERIQEYCEYVTSELREDLADTKYKILSEDQVSAHLFGIKIPEFIDKTYLQKRLTQAKIFVSYRGDFIRVSPHLYNNKSDLKRLVKYLKIVEDKFSTSL